MKLIRSLDDLHRFREEAEAARQRRASQGVQIVVSTGSCGIAAGALETLRAIQRQIEHDHLTNVVVSETGCAGVCQHEPIVEVEAAGAPRVTYGHVTPDAAARILREHLGRGQIVQEYVIEP
jgi:NADP-reducing hydrogenase subunit HndB